MEADSEREKWDADAVCKSTESFGGGVGVTEEEVAGWAVSGYHHYYNIWNME